VPPPQRLEREDAGVVAVVPRDVEAPSAVKAGVVDAQRRRAAGTGPDDLVSVAKTPACGARTTQAECHQVEAGDVPVEERDRDAVISLDNGVRRLVSIVHRHSLPRCVNRGKAANRLGHAVAAGPRSQAIREGVAVVATAGETRTRSCVARGQTLKRSSPHDDCRARAPSCGRTKLPARPGAIERRPFTAVRRHAVLARRSIRRGCRSVPSFCARPQRHLYG